MPITIADSLKLLAESAEINPSLFSAAPRKDEKRGIDVYSEHAFLNAFTTACRGFVVWHGRLPNLAAPKITADHIFRMKFFGYFPVSPNPGDKLCNLEYVPEELRPMVTRPKVIWVSGEPRLPSDGDVPPGSYYLKPSNGYHTHERIDWPVSPALRKGLEEKAGEWLSTTYGLGWGEWWYALTKQRLFIEQDLASALVNNVEYKLFCRRGEVKLILAVRVGGGPRSYFDSSFERLDGAETDCERSDYDLPDNIETMCKVAAGISRSFDVVRVDFFHTAGRPMLGELTLCHRDGQVTYTPDSFDAYVRQALFE